MSAYDCAIIADASLRSRWIENCATTLCGAACDGKKLTAFAPPSFGLKRTAGAVGPAPAARTSSCKPTRNAASIVAFQGLSAPRDAGRGVMTTEALTRYSEGVAKTSKGLCAERVKAKKHAWMGGSARAIEVTFTRSSSTETTPATGGGGGPGGGGLGGKGGKGGPGRGGGGLGGKIWATLWWKICVVFLLAPLVCR